MLRIASKVLEREIELVGRQLEGVKWYHLSLGQAEAWKTFRNKKFSTNTRKGQRARIYFCFNFGGKKL